MGSIFVTVVVLADGIYAMVSDVSPPFRSFFRLSLYSLLWNDQHHQIVRLGQGPADAHPDAEGAQRLARLREAAERVRELPAGVDDGAGAGEPELGGGRDARLHPVQS